MKVHIYKWKNLFEKLPGIAMIVSLAQQLNSKKNHKKIPNNKKIKKKQV